MPSVDALAQEEGATTRKEEEWVARPEGKGPAVSELMTQCSCQPAESVKVKWTSAVSERVVVETLG